MAKKTFARGIDAILDSQIDQNHQPAEDSVKNTSRNEIIKTSVNLEMYWVEQLRALAFWERKPLQDIWKEAVAQYLETKPEKCLKDALKHYAASKKMNSNDA